MLLSRPQKAGKNGSVARVIRDCCKTQLYPWKCGSDTLPGSCGDGSSDPSQITCSEGFSLKKFYCATWGPDGLDSPSAHESGGFCDSLIRPAPQGQRVGVQSRAVR